MGDVIWPGDKITGESGAEYEVGALIAYQGKEGCTDLRCRRMFMPSDGSDPAVFDWSGCMGYHCPRCDEPCSSQGHTCAPESTPGREGEAV